MNSDSGAWLSAGLSPKPLVMSNDEFTSAVCRRSAVEDLMVPKRTPSASRESLAMFQCGCDGGAQPKFIDPFGYHMVLFNPRILILKPTYLPLLHLTQ